MEKPTVFIVDDEKEVLNALTWMLEAVSFSVKTYRSASDFLKEDLSQSPGCLLLDVRMSEMNGLELQAHLLKEKISIPIIFMTGHADVRTAVRAMKLNAVDFLTKPINNQTLIEVVNKAICQDIRHRIKVKRNGKMAACAKQLTPREREVMQLIVKGRLTKAVASELGISPNTVEVHRTKILKKMQVSTSSELIYLSLSCGIVPLE